MDTNIDNKKVFRLLVFLLTVIILIILALVNSGRFNFFDVQVDNNYKHLDFELKNNLFGIYKIDSNCFFVYTDNMIKVLDYDYHEKWSDRLENIFEPVICHNKKILGVADLKSNNIYVYNQDHRLYFIKLEQEQNLVAFSVNKMGYCSCISKIKDFYNINVFDSTGKKILTYVHSEENIFPTSTSISPDGKILAISYIDTNNINIDSKVIFIYINQEKNIFACVQEKNSFIYKINFLSDKDICITSDNKIIHKNILDNNLKESWRLDLDKKIMDLKFNNNFFVIKHNDPYINNYSKNKSVLEFYNMESGKKIGEYKSNDLVDFINISDKINYILLASSNNFLVVNTKGKILWQHSVTGDYKFAMFLDKPYKILIGSLKKIWAINISSKSLINKN